jgi:AcrR family transcriptional regulator
MGRERTVDWSAFGTRTGGPAAAEGLRERKKRETRQLLSDTATEMFLAEGFDAVRVSAIAEVCGVSEKTVFNYFPTKEALVLDRFQTAPEALQAALGDAGTPAVEAILGMLAEELAAMTGWLAGQPDFAAAARQVQRFGELIGSTASLRAYQRDAADRLTWQAARLLAARAGNAGTTGTTAEGHAEAEGAVALEALVAANALLGLWRAQFAALGRHLGRVGSADELFDAVTDDVRRAAAVVRDGIQPWERTLRPGNEGPASSN